MEATAADFVQGERPLICFALGNLRQSVVKHILKHVQTKKTDYTVHIYCTINFNQIKAAYYYNGEMLLDIFALEPKFNLCRGLTPRGALGACFSGPKKRIKIERYLRILEVISIR